MEIEGKDLSPLEKESGGHRIQRVPPTERKGRVHTSTVTVAVINPEVSVNNVFSKRNDEHFKVEWYSGTGSGGQHRNKHQNSCRLTHLPTGIEQTAQTRSRTSSLNQAKTEILKILDEMQNSSVNKVVAQDRKKQVGSGMRGDKMRTYRFQDNTVTDHGTNNTAPCDKVMKGKFQLLWN